MLTSLRDETQKLVHNRPHWLTYAHIEEKTGIPAHWIRHFANNRYPDPGVNRVETLYAFLSGRELVL